MIAPPMIDTDKELKITLHSNQLRAYKSKERIVALISGIQGGKTRVGGLWMMKQIAKYDGPQEAFIIAGPNFKLMEKSTIPWTLHLLKGCGVYNKNDHKFTLNGGGTVWFASMTDDQSVEGATNVRAIWLDEAGLIRLNSWINILGRSSFKQCQIFITTTPYSLNWLYTDLYRPWQKGELDNVDVIQFRSIDNPYFPKEEYELQKSRLDPRVFERKYGGTFQRMAGLVYGEFDLRNICDPFLITDKYRVVAGVDFGYSNPFAVSIRAIEKTGENDYQIGEFYKAFLTAPEKVEVCQQLKKRYGIRQFYCDSEAPDDIKLMNNAGLIATGVEKPKGSVEYGISLHYALIKSKHHAIFKGQCPHTEDEYATYHYFEDKGKEENMKEEPVDSNNHLMDANRYVTLKTKYIRDQVNEPFVPVSTHLEDVLAGKYHKETEPDWAVHTMKVI